MECFKKRNFLLLILLLKLTYSNCEAIVINPQFITSGPDGQLTAEVLVNGNDVTFKWKSLMNNFAKIYLDLVSLHHYTLPKTEVLEADIDTYSFYKLISGEIYSIKICKLSRDNYNFMECASGHIQTKPNEPCGFIGTLHSETSLFVTWQRPSLGEFTHYEASITPSNQIKSVDQSYNNVTFDGLIPGKLYTISVQTVSRTEKSDPIEIKLRTVPPIPSKVRIIPKLITSTSFQLFWDQPSVECEFDHYNIYLNVKPNNVFFDNHSKKIVIDRKRNSYKFVNLVPGKKYLPFVQIVSGNLTSEAVPPAFGAITTKPLPILDLFTMEIEDGMMLKITWSPNLKSVQNEYSVTIIDKRYLGEKTVTEKTDKTYFISSTFERIDYEVTVSAVSDGVFSEGTTLAYRETTR